MHLGGITIPTTIDNHGRYLYSKEIIGFNGENEAVEGRFATINWTFDFMEMSDFTWLHDTLLLTAPSRKFTSASLKNNLGVVITPTNAVALRPTYEYASGGGVFNVSWQIVRIR